MKPNRLIPALRFNGFADEWSIKLASEFFTSSRARGHERLPIYSVTIDRGMVPRDSLDRTMTNDAIASDNLFVAKNDISYNMMRMWQGAYGLSPTECMVSPAYVVLRPKEKVWPQFFVRLFSRSRSLYLFTAYSYGLTSDRLRLYFKDFAQIKFAAPKFPEQQKIASFLSAVDEKMQLLTYKKELLVQYKKGVMQQLFSGKLRFKDEKEQDYPEWQEKRLDDLAEIVGGGTPETSIRKYWDGEIQWYTPTEIGERYVTKSRRTISKLGLEKSSAKLLPPGSILFTSRATIAELSFAKEQCATNQGFQSLIVNKFNNPIFIFYSIEQNKKIFVRKSQGSTFLEISKHEMQKIKIPMPHIDEQEKIGNYLSHVDNKIETITTQITQTLDFKKGLLQQMFV